MERNSHSPWDWNLAGIVAKRVRMDRGQTVSISDKGLLDNVNGILKIREPS